MKIKKQVSVEQEVVIAIGVDDIGASLAEASNCAEVIDALNSICSLLRALRNDWIALLAPEVRQTVSRFLLEQAKRFAEVSE